VPILGVLLRASWGTVALAVLCALVSGASSVGVVAVAHRTLSRLHDVPAALVATFVGLCLVVVVTRNVSRILLIRLTQGAVFELQVRLARRILAAPLRRIEEHGAPALLAALTDDVAAIGEALPAVPIIATNAATVAGCLVYLGYLAWPVLVALLVVFGLSALGYRWIVGRAMRAFERARAQRTLLFGHFRGLTDGAKELKLRRSRRVAFLAELLEPAAAAYRRLFVRGRVWYNFVSGWNQLQYFAVVGVILFVLPRVADLDPATVTGYVLTLFFVMSPLDEIMDWLPMFGRANVAVRTIEGLGLSLERVAEEAPDAIAGSASRADGYAGFRRIDVVGVTHAYHREAEERDFTLGPVDLTLVPGEIVFLIGGNGSGKTTLAKLLTGLYVPESGEIRLDADVVREATRDAYRERWTAVFSDAYLFDRLLGVVAPDLDARAREYLARLQLDHKVTVTGGVLSTTELSSGQRKRLALLAAYLDDRPLFLFDEWASDQDPLFKRVFYRTLLPELRARGKCVVVISHDDRYYDVADRTVKLESGRVVGETTSSELPGRR
jgi:putative ATP-binding cassette transporter